MGSQARITLGNSLLDTDQSMSMKIVETGGKFQLNLSIGIVASTIPILDNPSPAVRSGCRDVVLDKEMLAGGKGNIMVNKVSDTDGTVNVVIAFGGPGGAKIPGTGGVFSLLDLAGFDLSKFI